MQLSPPDELDAGAQPATPAVQLLPPPRGRCGRVLYWEAVAISLPVCCQAVALPSGCERAASQNQARYMHRPMRPRK